MILKASEHAPCATPEFARLVGEAGFPDGAVSVVTGDAENCVIPLTSSPDIDRVALTGGPGTTRHVVRNSAENFALTTRELGGRMIPLELMDRCEPTGTYCRRLGNKPAQPDGADHEQTLRAVLREDRSV